MSDRSTHLREALDRLTADSVPSSYSEAEVVHALAQGLGSFVRAALDAGLDVSLWQSGGWTMLATVSAPGHYFVVSEAETDPEREVYVATYASSSDEWDEITYERGDEVPTVNGWDNPLDAVTMAGRISALIAGPVISYEVQATDAQRAAIEAQVGIYFHPDTPCAGLDHVTVINDPEWGDKPGEITGRFHYLREDGLGLGLEETTYRADGSVRTSQDWG